MLLFMLLYKVALADSVDEILKCDHSNESYWAIPSCGTVFCFLFFYSNISLEHKTVIEPNSSTECWYSTKQEVGFLTSNWRFVLLEFFLLCTATGLVLVSVIPISHRMADVPCEINRNPWDNVSLVQETVIPYPAILYFTIPATRPLKNALSRSRLYLKFRFSFLFLTRIPNPALKISQIPNPVKPIVDPLNYAVQEGFDSVGEILKCSHLKVSYWAVLSCGSLYMLYKVVLTFESVDEMLNCDHSNESYWSVLSCGTVCYAVQGGSNFWVCGWNP